MIELLKSMRRYYLALVHSLNANNGFSQHGEDLYLKTQINQTNDDLFYIDIGSNHPTSINNTYWLYRIGGKGILVEPNQKFNRLYDIFRKRDIVINAGVGSSGIKRFYNASSTVTSGFKNLAGFNFQYCPLVRLDDLLTVAGETNVFLLSIDVEGMDSEVLGSGKLLLKKTKWVIIEFNDQESKILQIFDELEFDFVKQLGCNWIFSNRNL